MTDQLRRMIKKLEDDGPVEKHIILLKLSEALESAPEFGNTPVLDVDTPQRQWLSKVGALLSRLDPIGKKAGFNRSFSS